MTVSNGKTDTPKRAELERLIRRYSMAHNTAFREIDPHNHDKHPNGDGMDKVFDRRNEIADKALEEAWAWHEQEIAEAVKTLHRKIDMNTDLIEKIQPGRYDGSPSIDARTLQNTICEFRNDLEAIRTKAPSHS